MDSLTAWNVLVSLLLGISLSAACGFRVFVPFLVMSLASHSGQMQLASNLDWIGSTPALILFAVAAVVEVAAYYIPFIDEVLDLAVTPLAVVAGMVMTASVLTDVDPMVQWTMAIIAGGGAAAATQGLTDITRLTSTLTTGGIANPLLSTMELGTSTTLSVMALLLPVLTGLIVIGVIVYALRKIWIFLRHRRRASSDIEP